MKILLWFILLILCWPLALVLLILYPLFWLISIPFRIVGFALDGVLEFIKAIFMLPSRIVGSRAK